MNLDVGGTDRGGAAATVPSVPVVVSDPPRSQPDAAVALDRPAAARRPDGPWEPEDVEPRRGVMSTVVHELIEYRDLLWQLTLRDVRIRYAQAVMGLAWAVLMPIVIVLSGLLIRYAMAQHADVGIGQSVIAGIAIKGLLWAFFSSALAMGTMSLVANKHLVTKLYFPREVLPLATLFAQSFDLLIGLTVVTIMLPFLGATASLNILWVLLLVPLLFGLTLACTTLLSCANLFFRDVKYIVQVVTTFGMFIAPVFFEPAMFGPVGARIAMLNPIAPIMEGARLAVVEGHNLLVPLEVVNAKGLTVLAWTPFDLLYALLFVVVGMNVSVRIFRRASAVFAEYA